MDIVWINPDDIYRLEARLYSNRAGIRLRCIEPARYLSSAGHNVRSLNIFQWQTWSKDPAFYAADVYVVGKAFVNIIQVLERLNNLGKKIVIDVCDNIYEPPEDGLKAIYQEIMPFANLVIASTQTLADILVERANVRVEVIPDHVEGEKISPSFKPDIHSLNLLWFGYPNNLALLDSCLPRLEALTVTHNVTLSVVTGWNEYLLETFGNGGESLNIKHVDWSPDNMKKELQACDIVIVPSLMTPARTTKTANRVMTGLYAGKHVVAYPLPSYQEFSPFICLDKDMARGISTSLKNPDDIMQRITSGQKYIDEHYSPDIVSKLWENALLTA